MFSEQPRGVHRPAGRRRAGRTRSRALHGRPEALGEGRLRRRDFLLALLAAPALAGSPEALQILAQLKKQTRTEGLEAGRRYFAGKETPDTPETRARWEGQLRILEPLDPRGYLLQLHGGGWCLGSALSGEPWLRTLAAATRLTIVSPDYRLAPEHPSPAAQEDCLAAARWVLDQKKPACIMGSSAGAHLAALTMQTLKGWKRAVLWYGVYDLTRQRTGDHPDLQPDYLERLTQRYAAGQDLRKLSPLFGPRVDVPTLMLVGDRDVLYEENTNLAALWPNAELAVYEDGFHGFDGYDLPMAREARQKVTAWLLRE